MATMDAGQEKVENRRDKLMLLLAEVDNQSKDCFGVAACIEEILLGETPEDSKEEMDKIEKPTSVGWIGSLCDITHNINSMLIKTISILTRVRDEMK